MKTFRFLIFIAVLLTACNPTAAATESPTASLAIPTATEQASHERYGVMRTSLEIARDGKTYDVLIGYDFGKALVNAVVSKVATPEIPEKKFSQSPHAGGAILQWVGDIDKDGETEYIVGVYSCGAYCAGGVQAIDYDSRKDEYRVFDTVETNYVDDYSDINKDGSPEIITRDFEYNWNVGGCGMCQAISPIKIYNYDGKEMKFVGVTSQYTDLVENDSKKWLGNAKTDMNGQGDGYLALAAYLYDMYLLGQQEQGTQSFSEICMKFVQPKMVNAEWKCEDYLAKVKDVLSEMKIGNK